MKKIANKIILLVIAVGTLTLFAKSYSSAHAYTLQTTSVVCDLTNNTVTMNWSLDDPSPTMKYNVSYTIRRASDGLGISQIFPAYTSKSYIVSYPWNASSLTYDITISASSTGSAPFTYTNNVSGTCLPNYTASAPGAICGATGCSKKELGDINPIGNTFTSTTTGKQNKPAWVRVKVNGPQVTASPVPYAGADIMFALDASSSLVLPMPVSSSGGSISRLNAAKNALAQFISATDETKDYVGLLSYTYCNQYNAAASSWAYDDFWSNPINGSSYNGVGLLHFPLRSINGIKSQIITALNNINMVTGSAPIDQTSYVNYCTIAGANGTQQFSIGGAISIASTQFTPIISDTKAKRSDATLYINSKLRPAKTNAGSSTRGGSYGKYLILFADRDENAAPNINATEMDKNGRTIIQTAQFYGIKIYTVLIGDTTNAAATTKLQAIATQTGGQFYSAATQDEAIASLNAIRNTINSVSSGGGGALSSKVKVSELINQTNFRINTPTYNTSFKITSGSGSETDTTNSICPDTTPADGTPDCITNIIKDGSNRITGMDIQLDTLNSGAIRNIYFKVTPIAQGTNININSNTGVLNYQDITTTTALDLGAGITIDPPTAYTQTTTGDIYSAGGTGSDLPAGKYFTTDSQSLVMHNAAANYGSGSVSPSGRELSSYTINAAPLYSKYYSLYMNNITTTNVSTLAMIPTPGYYMDTSGGDVVIQNIPLAQKNITSGNYVIFVNGNLFIRDSFTIAKNANTSVVFIVSGNIGIDPSVTNSEGIYLADGIIDTSCAINTFDVNNKCTPNSGSVAGGTQLALNGTFYAHGGLLLDRYGTPGSVPGELFNDRPDMILSAAQSLGQKIYSWKENKQ
jgi:hypothetical protein